MPNAVVLHPDQPIIIECGNPTELIFTVTDPPVAGIGSWSTKFLLKDSAGNVVTEIDGEMNKGEDAVTVAGSIRVLIPSDDTADLTPGGQYRWDHWRILTPSDPKLLSIGPATLRRTVRFPTTP